MVKVSIIGSTGIIGKNVAFTLAREDSVDEIVMFSRPESLNKAKGETYDMYDALAARDIDCRLTPSADFEDIAGSAIVLIAAGAPRKKGMKRLDLASINAEIVAYYSKKIAEYSPDSIILVATNPVDVMTTVALKASGLKKSKVIVVGGSEEDQTNVAAMFNCNTGKLPMKYLGVMVSDRHMSSSDLAYVHHKVEKKLPTWQSVGPGARNS